MSRQTAAKVIPHDEPASRQVNIRVRPSLFRALQDLARQERRTVPQAARTLLEDGLRSRFGGQAATDDLSAIELAQLAVAGRSFVWLEAEPDLYDERSGEPI